MTGFEAYRLYVAIHLHFTTNNYDYFKYNGATTITQSNFLHIQDKHTFYKLSRTYPIHKDLEQFYVAQYVHSLIGKDSKDVRYKFLNPESRTNYLKLCKNLQALTRLFKDDYNKILENIPKDEIFQIKNNLSKLFQLFVNGMIQIETLVILNSKVSFVPYWDKNLKSIFWESCSHRIKKYEPWVII